MRLMIVDDDYQIREGMRLGVEWEKLGIHDVIACANGIEAMEEFRKQAPDIILADIQMPGMTGLEMVTKIREVNTEVRVIFISAYSEFEYCRQALKLGADDYILKPIQFEKLEETILKNVEILQKSRTESDQYRNAMLERELRQIYEKGQNNGAGLCRLLKEEYSFLEEGWFLTGTVDFHQKMDEEELKIFVQNIEPALFPDKNGAVLQWGGNKMIILAKGSSSELLAIYQQAELRNKISYWNQTNGERFGMISVGISRTHDINSFNLGYEEAMKAMKYCFYQGAGGVNIYSAVLKQVFSEEEENRLVERFIKALHSSSFDKTKEEILLWEAELKKDSIFPDVLKTAGWNIFRKLCKKEKIVELPTDLEKNLENTKYLEDFLNIFSGYLERYIWSTKYLKDTGKKYSRTVKMALDYVDEHYGEPLTLSWVAEHVGKSTNYFGSVFKKETGMAFTEYLTEYRMEKAKQLLVYTNKKIKDICEEVGYTDYTYFSQIFKQVHGCSASQMRREE